MAAVTISQRANNASDFGLVLRSSAIFYYRNDSKCRTTIALLNYWKIKRNMQVGLAATTRDMNGRLLQRELLTFTDGETLNYRPSAADQGVPFEGSVEIEVFGTTNLVIPYAAVMGVYETAGSISMIHSYSRTYSRHEVEEKRIITDGEEACWTLRDSTHVRSFAVFHNGGRTQPAQTLKLIVRNSRGQLREAMIELPEKAPYASVKVIPQDHIADLSGFLNGNPGFASLSFKVNESFTRMLVANENHETPDFQVTHSNFNFSLHATDHVDEVADHAYMYVPAMRGLNRAVYIYPNADRGAYTCSRKNETLKFRHDEACIIPLAGSGELLAFAKINEKLPTRIVTAIVCGSGKSKLPAECSLGVVNPLRPDKRLSWGLCAADPERRSRLLIDPTSYVCGEFPADGRFTVRLHSARAQKPLEASFTRDDLGKFDDGAYFDDIFPGACEHLGGQLGWYTVGSGFGGLTCYSTIEKPDGSVTLEHSF